MASRKRSPKTEARTETRKKTLDAKTEKAKAALLERLSKTPIIESAAKAAGVGRSTYYKWLKEDGEFAKLAEQTIIESRKFVNDIALSKLMQLIDQGHVTALIFWLKNNHEWFSERVWHQHMHRIEDEGRHTVDPDITARIRKTMMLFGIKNLKMRQQEKETGKKISFDPHEREREEAREKEKKQQK
jgi:hypothetical protein